MNLPHLRDAVEIKLPTLLPHELFHATYSKGPMLFNHCTVGDLGSEGIIEFWKTALTEPWAMRHPIIAKHRPGDMFPIVWHLDGGEIHKNSEYYELQMGTILVQYAGVESLDGRFLICVHQEIQEDRSLKHP